MSSSPSSSGHPASELPPKVLADLVNAVKFEISLTETLSEIIGQEREAIATSNIDALNQLVDKKKAVADSLDKAGGQRDQFIRSLGFEPSSQGINQLRTQSSASEFAAAWQDLRAMASHCQEQNRLLGVSLSKFLLATNQSIDILHSGHQAARNTYGPKGLVSRDGESSTIAKI